MILTPRQERAIDRIRNTFPHAIIDAEGTQMMRATVPGAATFVNVIANLAGREIRMWTLDEMGDVVMESGAEPDG